MLISPIFLWCMYLISFQSQPLMMLVYVLQLLSVATFFGAIFCFAAFCFKSLYAFIALFAIGELLVFATQVIFFLNHFVLPTYIS